MQVDSLAELQAILSTQKVDSKAAEQICESVFFQTKPHVPLERIGKDSLPGMEEFPRASLSLLEFQEFRVRAAVANLRIMNANGDKETFSAEDYDAIVDFLMSWRSSEPPRWLDVAEFMSIPVRKLVKPSLEEGGTSSAPFDRTSRTIEAKFNKNSQIGKWWRDSEFDERSELVAVISNAITSSDGLSDAVEQFVEGWSDETMEKLDALSLESGRASYSRESLTKLLKVMREERCDAYEARKRAFNVPDGWEPPKSSFSDPIDHPTLLVILALVRRFLITANQQWGEPERVVVEHVRSAFFGPSARAEFENELKSNERRRLQVDTELRSQGVERPSHRDRRRYEAIQRQGNVCLYCGAHIDFSTCELDHIIADSQGGSNRMDNLVAVCRPCNSGKGKLPFHVFAQSSKRSGVSVAEATERLKLWQPMGMPKKQHDRLTKDVARRLGLDSMSGIEEERSIESTAYAASEMRNRINTFLKTEVDTGEERSGPRVLVFSGSVTHEARRAGGVDERLRLRESTSKTRFDRRHHAIDAAVLTTVSDIVATTLRARSQLGRSNQMTGKEPGWKEFDGSTQIEQINFRKWRKQAQELAGLLEKEIEADRVAVVRPRRLSPRVGSVHKDTINPLVRKSINEAFTPDELLRVCDTKLFYTLNEMADPKAGLGNDPQRADSLGRDVNELVNIFPSSAASLKVRGGSVMIGDTVQHARIYAWKTKTGYAYGMVRMFSGEFAKIGFSKDGVDLMTADLPAHSQSMRCAPAALRNRILAGEAKQIGWITVNDEIEIDVEKFSHGDAKISKFLLAFPERRWVITGFYDESRISIAPLYLASEGISDDTPEAVSAILQANRIPLAVNQVMGGDGVTVVRRTVLGRPRWTGGLPSSWAPAQRSQQLFNS